jgi:hypothetical protein
VQIEDHDGHVWLNLECDTTGAGGNALTPGDGVIARLVFITSTDVNLAGQYGTIDFDFLEPGSMTENIIYQPDSTLIGFNQLEYNSGGLLLKESESLLGDLNLNGVPFEVADLVYFSQYFIDPIHYPLTGERWLNSDINQDGQPGTLADLIYMQAIVNGDEPKLAYTEIDQLASYLLETDGELTRYVLTSSHPPAGAYFKFMVPDQQRVALALRQALANTEVTSERDGDTLRVLVVGSPLLESGVGTELFGLIGAADVKLVEQSLVDDLGREIPVELQKPEAILPEGYRLDQNYPNPFNPETQIVFALPEAGLVRLEVFNVLGQSVRLLLAEELPAGEHQVYFDGRGDDGRPLGSGVYFYRLQSDEFLATKKMVLLK